MPIEYYTLIDFLKKEENWIESLEERKIKVGIDEERELCILKYRSGADFKDPIVRACRGTVIEFAKPHKIVCAPFVKFFNYEEPDPTAKEINKIFDWSNYNIYEKMDGSLVNVWFYKGEWIISTTGTIGGNNALSDKGNTVKKLVEDVLKNNLGFTFSEWAQQLDRNYTYSFELTSLDNKIVISYPTSNLWFLTRRDNRNLKEDTVNDTKLFRPKKFENTSFFKIIKNLEEDSSEHEGIILVDSSYNRIKIKTETYIERHLFRVDGQITTKTFLKLMQGDAIDDFLGLYPEYTSRYKVIEDKLKKIGKELEEKYEKFKINFEGDKTKLNDLLKSQKGVEQSFFVKKYKWDKNLTGYEFLLSLRIRSLKKVLNDE